MCLWSFRQSLFVVFNLLVVCRTMCCVELGSDFKHVVVLVVFGRLDSPVVLVTNFDKSCIGGLTAVC